MNTANLASATIRIGVLIMMMTIAACSQEPAPEAQAERAADTGVKSGPGRGGSPTRSESGGRLERAVLQARQGRKMGKPPGPPAKRAWA